MSEYPRFEEVKGSDLALVGAIGLAVLIQLSVFFIITHILVGATINGYIYWPSVAVWAAFGFGVSIRKVEPKRKGRQNSYAFVFLMFLTLAVSNIYTPMQSFNLAFEGFFLGLGAYGAGIIAKRHIGSSPQPRLNTENYQP